MGKREITEKTFEFTANRTIGLVFAVVIFPTWLYFNIKDGMQKKDAHLGRENDYL